MSNPECGEPFPRDPAVQPPPGRQAIAQIVSMGDLQQILPLDKMDLAVLLEMLVVVRVRVEAAPEGGQGGRLPPPVGIEAPAPRIEPEEVAGAMDVEVAGSAVERLKPVLPHRVIRIEARRVRLRRSAPAAVPVA